MKAIIDVSEEAWNTIKGYLPFQSQPIILSDKTTNGDIIQTMFPNVITEETAVTMHLSTKVTCCGDKHCKGALSYDFWKEWWNAPYKEQNNGNSKADD